MTQDEAETLLPRFLNAVTTMASASDKTLRNRLAWVVDDVLVFSVTQIPEDIREQYMEFYVLVSSPVVPSYAQNHPYFPMTVPAAYLSPRKAKRAADLLCNMLEAIVYSLDS